MYHYVRQLKGSKYPNIKGLSVDLFREQLKYITKYYAVVRMEEVIEATQTKQNLPENALLLTFDDGYKDHLTYVLPILKEFGVQGSFFPPANAVLENKVLDVNKIHYVLASVDDSTLLIKEIFEMLDQNREKYNLKDNSYYFNKLALANRFDSKEIIFIKRILQRELPLELRKKMIDQLFQKYVTKDEKSFAKELYLNLDELRYLKKQGMFIGSHSHSHFWLNTLDKELQEKEIDLSLKFLKNVGCDLDNWVMCYPYGGYNDS